MPGRLVPRRDNPQPPIVMGEDPVTIGRGRACDVCLINPFLSERHLTISWDGTRHLLADTSRNGTFLNGTRIPYDTLTPINEGDVLVLPGQPALTYTFELLRETETWAPEAGSPATGLVIDADAGRVWVDGREVELRPKELLALLALHRRRGRLVTKDQLAAEVWPEHGGAIGDNDLSVLIHGLRRKVEPDPAQPVWVITVPRVGFRLEQN